MVLVEAEEGFMPLRRAVSEPAKGLYTGTDYLSARLLGSSARLELNGGGEWKPVSRMASFTKQAVIHEDKSEEPKAVVVVDPFSTGALLATRAVALGYRVIRVLSDGDSPVASLVAEGICVDYDATIVIKSKGGSEYDYDDAAHKLRALPFNLMALFPGAETGVLAADELVVRLGMRGNANAHSKARRNKYLMGEVVKQAGVRAVSQQNAKNWNDAKEFLTRLAAEAKARNSSTIYPVVVKPIESAGSDDVFKCQNEAEVKKAVEEIAGKVNGLGVVNEGALVQEFLKGNEYVVDSVSRDGVQKVVTIWKYDKRAVNDANFVYHGMSLVDVEGGSEEEKKVAKLLVDYSKSVLEALSITNGPSHMEVMLEDGGCAPCLVEVGSRCHGGEGSWSPIVKDCTGYDQVDATLMSYLDPEAFDKLSSTPPPLKKYGSEIFFVNRRAGMIRSTDRASNFIRNLPSCTKIEWQVKSGDFAELTVDCFTRPGSAQLVHEDRGQLLADYESIRKLELPKPGSGYPCLLDLEFVCRVPIEKGTVVVVDPYSSGAILAARVRSVHRKNLVIVHSDPESPVATLVPTGTSLQPHAVVMHHGDAKATAKAILGHARAVIACIPGAETGVLLADELAEILGTRSNPPELSEARRNKYLMGEAVRKAGVRAVEQIKASTWSEAEDFLARLEKEKPANKSSIYPLVVKPVESAGSDDVYKCQSAQDVKTAVEIIVGKQNGLGNTNECALVQEFLKGDEYVIDGVSRDGEHKIVAVWKYDKRSVNGANFVYYAMSMVDFSSEEGEIARALAEYSTQVRDALHIRDGPSHMEVKFDPETRKPCLVEVGARCHGGEGTWQPVADACVGCNQIDAALNSIIDADAFDELPAVPPSFKNNGREVFLVSKQEGVVKVCNVEKVRRLKSFAKMELAVQPGSTISPTVDCFTRPGSIQLIHPDPAVVQADYDEIRRLEDAGELFTLQ